MWVCLCACVLMCTYVCAHVNACTCVMVHVWRSEDNSWGSLTSSSTLLLWGRVSFVPYHFTLYSRFAGQWDSGQFSSSPSPLAVGVLRIQIPLTTSDSFLCPKDQTRIIRIEQQVLLTTEPSVCKLLTSSNCSWAQHSTVSGSRVLEL